MDRSTDGRWTSIPQPLPSDTPPTCETVPGVPSNLQDSGTAGALANFVSPESSQQQPRPQERSQWPHSVPFVQSTYSSLAGAVTETTTETNSPSYPRTRPSSDLNAPAPPQGYSQFPTFHPQLDGYYNSATYRPQETTTSTPFIHAPSTAPVLSSSGSDDHYARHRPTPSEDLLIISHHRTEPISLHARRRIVPSPARGRPHTRGFTRSDNASPSPNNGIASTSDTSWSGPARSYGTNESYTSIVEPASLHAKYLTDDHFDSSPIYPPGAVHPFSQPLIPPFPGQEESHATHTSPNLDNLSQHSSRGDIPVLPTAFVTDATHSLDSFHSHTNDTTWRGRFTYQNVDAQLVDPSTGAHAPGYSSLAVGAGWTTYHTNPYGLYPSSNTGTPSSSISQHADLSPPSLNTSFSPDATRFGSEPKRAPTFRKRRQSPSPSPAQASSAPRHCISDEIDASGHRFQATDRDRLTNPVHIHVVNVAVANGYLTPGLARRLVWETIDLVETSNWSRLQATSTASTNPEEYDEEARRAIEVEFDLTVLQEQTTAIRAQLLNFGLEEVVHPPSGPHTLINAVDLSNAPQFARLMMKRAVTFERYYCSNRKCGADFTRVDALHRHEKSCYKSRPRPRANSTARVEAGPLIHGDSAYDNSVETEDDWMLSISS
ncbi:hypothetical protein FRB96_002769 [Tulasnella sp. 330]|nr:hypothetical protein FRB96_002769 [Tulasnella sp. 330]